MKDFFSLEGITRSKPKPEKEEEDSGVVKKMGAAARDEVDPVLERAAGRLAYQLLTPITDWGGAEADEGQKLEASEASSEPESSGPGAFGLLAQIVLKATGRGAKALGRAAERKLGQGSRKQPILEDQPQVVEGKVIDVTPEGEVIDHTQEDEEDEDVIWVDIPNE